VFSGWEGVHSGVGVGIGVGLEEEEEDGDGDGDGDIDDGEVEVVVEGVIFLIPSSSRYAGEQYSRGRPRALYAIVGLEVTGGGLSFARSWSRFNMNQVVVSTSGSR